MSSPTSADDARSGTPMFGGEVAREPRLSDKVAELLRDGILSRGLPVGTPLPSERELGEQFGVSRTVIREAVRALAAKGIVEARSGSGLRVSQIDEAAASESLSWYIRGGGFEYWKVHELRSMIEVGMAGLAAERRTDDHLEALKAAHAKFVRNLADVDAAARADLDFHAQIARAAENDLFQVILESVSSALIDIRRENLASGAGKKTVTEHKRILDRIATRDADGARSAMAEHLENVLQNWERQHGSRPEALAQAT
jgi:GntR family transcriptional repressor for pyruvate dehydrogenase complex